jgi:hypothetical protein
MRWNLRLAAANRGIWKASELQRLLAERALVISAGKMSGLWSGQPASMKRTASGPFRQVRAKICECPPPCWRPPEPVC